MSRLLAILLLLAMPAGPAAAQTRLLRGRVMALDGVSASALSLRIIGIGDAAVTRSGEFSLEIPADRVEVTFESSDPERPIVYPPDARAPVPAGDALVVLVIGRPVEEEIRRTLADRSRQLEQILRDNGIETGARIDSLESGIRRVLELLQLREEDLRAEIRQGEDRAERYASVATPTREWLDRATDLVTGLRLMRPLLREGRQQVMNGVSRVVTAYSTAWNAWSAGRDAALADVRRFWPPEDAAIAEQLFDEIERTHRARILPLNEALVALQTALIDRRPDSDVERALSALDVRTTDLDGEIQALRTRIERTLERLRPT